MWCTYFFFIQYEQQILFMYSNNEKELNFTFMWVFARNEIFIMCHV